MTGGVFIASERTDGDYAFLYEIVNENLGKKEEDFTQVLFTSG